MKQAQADDKQDDQSKEERSHSSRHSVDHDEKRKKAKNYSNVCHVLTKMEGTPSAAPSLLPSTAGLIHIGLWL